MRCAGVCITLMILAGACAPSDPVAHAARQWEICAGLGVAQERLHACSDVIASEGAAPERRAAALVERGVQRAQLGQHLRAVGDFGRALRIDPRLVRAYIERGQVHHERGAYESAVADFDAALALEPGLRSAVIGRDLALRGREDMLAEGLGSAADELEALTSRLAANPRDATLWNSRCWIRAVQGEELEFALSDCNEALRLDPRHAAALDSRGLVHIKRGEFSEAIADYNAALALDPGRGHYLYGRGVARIRMGEFALGQADLAAAERAEPGVARMYRTYGVAI